ncbi:tyrosine-type recombinase/integrase [Burkholderia sp. WAC0059]|uniref:tyrosine-type recombinase/integrase n=1 Tax=Burkholderia sp. WAC0059 TaxID=2066022 RepID=UPI0015E0C112|nr:site-specific integrase [Burkholderia sp. WAC0059]
MSGKPVFPEGAGWAFRTRVGGQRIYRSGFPSEAAALAERAYLRAQYDGQPRVAGLGPFRTTVAVAWSSYALERLKMLKGARQDANRINRYLRAAGLPVVRLGPPDPEATGGACRWSVWLEAESGRTIINSLKVHRARQADRTARSDALRAQLAATLVASVTTHQLEQLVGAMIEEGASAATIDHERAEWRRLFSHARTVWHWAHPARNPAGGLKTPRVDNARNRVLTNDEWRRLAVHLVAYRNRNVLPLLCLMLETAMRSCEPLAGARWSHVRWGRRVLSLPDGKTGRRDVPLNPGAMALLGEMRKTADLAGDDGPIFPGLTYEQMKKAWAECCRKAGIENVKAHDLRHTSATRYAHEFNGNLPVIMQITGHKTVKMAMRYINITSDDVVRLMHGDDGDVGQLPAGYRMALREPVTPPEIKESCVGGRDHSLSSAPGAADPDETSPDGPQPPSGGGARVIRVDFGRRAA